MLYSVLGTSGMRVSKLALGTATFGVAPTKAEADRVIGAAMDAGINLIDTANAYGNLAHFDRPGAPPANERSSAEEIIGACLKGRRDELVISTKASEPIGPNVNDRGLSRRHLVAQIDRSLSRLRTDHVDIFYAHHPDPDTPLEDTLMTLDDLVRSGKARTYGLSTYPAWATVHALWTARQAQPSLPGLPTGALQPGGATGGNRDRPRGPPVRALPGGVQPLGRGAVDRRGQPAPAATGARCVGVEAPSPSRSKPPPGSSRRLAGEWGCSPAQLALAWVLQRPAVASAIIGPESSEELEDVVGAVDLGAQLSAEPVPSAGRDRRRPE